MSRLRRVAVVMDPPERIRPAKDSTVALMLAAQARGAALCMTTAAALRADAGGAVTARVRPVTVADRGDWCRAGAEERAALADFDAVLMRKDPPFDLGYLAATWLLERARADGACVLNAPAALRGWNEKLAVLDFPELAPPMRVSADAAQLLAFLDEYNEIVIKPLDRMGGAGVFRLRRDDAAAPAALAAATAGGAVPVAAQRFLPEVADGDRRLLLIDGELAPHVVVRVPRAGEFRANLARGARARAEPADDRDRRVAARLAEPLRAAGVCFAGADVIGDRLTELNITSPTCMREVEAQAGWPAAARFWDAVEDRWLGG